MGINICSTPFITVNTIADKVVSNTLGLLLQSRIRGSSVGKDTIIVAEDERRFGTRDSHHSYLVT